MPKYQPSRSQDKNIETIYSFKGRKPYFFNTDNKEERGLVNITNIEHKCQKEINYRLNDLPMVQTRQGTLAKD